MELISFLGLCNIFRFILNYARLAAQLFKKLQNNQPAEFGPLYEEEILGINTLKEALLSPLILALPSSTGYVTLDTDTRDKQILCVLLKKQDDGTTQPIGYWSCLINDAEKR